MAFVKVDKARRIRGMGAPVITMGSYLADGKLHKSKSVAFRISAALVEQIGWKADDGRIRLSVFEGTDKDKGFLQLMPTEDGYAGTFRNKSQGVSINVTIERFKHYVLNECPTSAQPVDHIIDGEALVVECPDWLRFNPQTVPEPEPAPVTELHTRRGPGRPRRQAQ